MEPYSQQILSLYPWLATIQKEGRQAHFLEKQRRGKNHISNTSILGTNQPICNILPEQRPFFEKSKVRWEHLVHSNLQLKHQAVLLTKRILRSYCCAGVLNWKCIYTSLVVFARWKFFRRPSLFGMMSISSTLSGRKPFLKVFWLPRKSWNVRRIDFAIRIS